MKTSKKETALDKKYDVAENLGKQLAKKYNYYKIIMFSTQMMCTANVQLDINIDGEYEFEIYDESSIENNINQNKDCQSALKKMKDITKEIKQLAKQHNVTPDSIWEEWIYWSDEEDIV